MDHYTILVPVPVMDPAMISMLTTNVLESFVRGDEIIIRPVPEDEVREAFGGEFDDEDF